MSLIALPYTFQAGTVIASSQVNANFTAITNVVNGNLDSTNFSTVLTNSNFSATGHVTISGGFVVQWGTVNSVPFDNSAATAVTFDINFPNAVFAIDVTVIENTQSATHAAGVSAYPSSPAVSGFNLNALGGAAGTTGSVYYIAIGY